MLFSCKHLLLLSLSKFSISLNTELKERIYSLQDWDYKHIRVFCMQLFSFIRQVSSHHQKKTLKGVMWLILVYLLLPFHQQLEDIEIEIYFKTGLVITAKQMVRKTLKKKERIMQIAETDQPTHIMALVSDQLQSRLHFLQARQEYAEKRLGRKGSRFFVF